MSGESGNQNIEAAPVYEQMAKLTRLFSDLKQQGLITDAFWTGSLINEVKPPNDVDVLVICEQPVKVDEKKFGYNSHEEVEEGHVKWLDPQTPGYLPVDLTMLSPNEVAAIGYYSSDLAKSLDEVTPYEDLGRFLSNKETDFPIPSALSIGLMSWSIANRAPFRDDEERKDLLRETLGVLVYYLKKRGRENSSLLSTKSLLDKGVSLSLKTRSEIEKGILQSFPEVFSGGDFTVTKIMEYLDEHFDRDTMKKIRIGIHKGANSLLKKSLQPMMSQNIFTMDNKTITLPELIEKYSQKLDNKLFI